MILTAKINLEPLNQIQLNVLESGVVGRALEYHSNDRGFAPTEERSFFIFLLKFKSFEDGCKPYPFGCLTARH